MSPFSSVPGSPPRTLGTSSRGMIAARARGERHCAHADLVSSRFCVSGYTELAKWSARASVKVMNKGMEAPSPLSMGSKGRDGDGEASPSAPNPRASARLPSAEARLIEQLSVARAHLQRELGEGDLIYLNEPGPTMRQWAWLPLEALTALEARLVAAAAAGFAAPIAAAPPNEADIVDSRLTRKVTLAFKAIALSDLCDRLQSDTGIRLAAGPSVADEKVSLFCEHTPLREVMRQLSRPFGYTWLRSRQALGVGRQALGDNAGDPNAQRPTPNASYRYDLVQDLRSQLLEEELRNRDRNAAFIALEQEIQRYRPYLDLSPDDALARAKTAPPE